MLPLHKKNADSLIEIRRRKKALQKLNCQAGRSSGRDDQQIQAIDISRRSLAAAKMRMA